jgi:hypothetical protein
MEIPCHRMHDAGQTRNTIIKSRKFNLKSILWAQVRVSPTFVLKIQNGISITSDKYKWRHYKSLHPSTFCGQISKLKMAVQYESHVTQIITFFVLFILTRSLHYQPTKCTHFIIITIMFQYKRTYTRWGGEAWNILEFTRVICEMVRGSLGWWRGSTFWK